MKKVVAGCDEVCQLGIPLQQRGETIMAMSVSMPVFRALETLRATVLDLLFTAQKNIDAILGSLPALSPSI